ncbi:NYN domain-containing protein [Actinomyces bowdenii]|uniref:NYN domain-containing protein n=1 Tax=Actinomyces bowdenii TaxID=131109 RepID=A0A3P1V4N3_9ACTO|nr:NYN domain-containing protein [Actinomyces bowdenii]RRD29184.1 NYN domain-containing protein [Actinomyces bowdenii]
MNIPTYLLVDGENIDATLGMSVLGRRPEPEERPRWDRVLSYCDEIAGMTAKPTPGPMAGQSGRNARALFFLNATSGHMPMGFIQALLAMDYRPVPLAGSGSAEEKVVDIGIQRTLEALAQKVESGEQAQILLGSHDGDYVPQVERLLDAGAQVGILCFREFLNAHLTALESRGLTIHDLELDVRAFTSPLPRVRIISLADFDPLAFL